MRRTSRLMSRRSAKWCCGLGMMVLSSLGSYAEPSATPLVPSPVIGEGEMDAQALESSITAGVDYLVQAQNKGGSWGSARRTKYMSIYAPVPGAHDAFRTASSALALSGLIASGDQRPEVLATIEKGEAWLLDALKTLRRAEGTTTYNNWGHAYALRALSSLAGREGVTTEKLALYKKTAQHQVEMLVRFQDIDGGWGYLHQDSITRRPSGGSMSFTTSTVLLAMHEAREVLGVTLPEKRIQQALRSIRQQRVPDFAYVYAMEHRFYTREPINRPGGSLARSQVCNAATRQWGDEAVTDEVIVEWLDRLIKRNGWLDMARKRTRPHDSHFANSGYFYYYGHYYASECIHLLPNGQQNEWKDKLARVLVRKQEKDGAWWDYPLYDYHKAYGTGYALTTLSRCRK